MGRGASFTCFTLYWFPGSPWPRMGAQIKAEEARARTSMEILNGAILPLDYHPAPAEEPNWRDEKGSRMRAALPCLKKSQERDWFAAIRA